MNENRPAVAATVDAPDDGGDPDATLAAAFPRIWGASSFLRCALVSEGFSADAPTVAARPADPAADPASAGAFAWLLDLARLAWTEHRLESRYRHNLHALASLPGTVRPSVGVRAGRGAPQREDAVARALRRTRRQLLCGLLMRDSSGLATLEEVTGAMTAFAELAVRELLQRIAPDMAEQFGTPVDAAGAPQDLLVLAMGKAGGAELNVSSDLDLIFVYGEVAAFRRTDSIDPPVDATGRGAGARQIDGQEFFDRLGRRLIAALGHPDDQGFVFRVDMRLRPHGESGPLVVGLAMLEEYLLREGREWERFAWAKARVISAPVLADRGRFGEQCAALDAVVQPFIYRKYFDFGAIGAIRELHQRIGAEARRAAKPWLGQIETARDAAREPVRDVKLGRGGIREIEFLAQTYSIMRGGRDHRLRARGTVATLRVLAQLDLLEPALASRLIEDYRFLRRLEHALQYREDAQTHTIPTLPVDRLAVAQLLGMATADELLDRYGKVSEAVARSFDGMFPTDARMPGGDGTEAAGAGSVASTGASPPLAGPIDGQLLQSCGFPEPDESAEKIRQLLASTRLSAMSAPARAAVARLAGQAVRIIAQITRDGQDEGAPGADQLLLRWIRLIEVIGRRSTYFALLVEYPHAHERVLRLLAAGGWPTEYLLRHPILLDELIVLRPQRFADDRRLDDLAPVPGAAEPYWEPWIEEVDGQLRACEGDMERQMNILRDAHHAQVFRLLLADLSGELQLEHLADHLSALADAVLKLALPAAWRSLEAARADPTVSAPRLAIVAYGKLGGRELGYASDLDLAFVFDEGVDAQQAERNTTLSTQLVRRLLTWLTSVTSSGVLFEIDLRLRPNGNAGLLVTPILAFERYQNNADGHGAWVWEHQALTRARACAGDAQLGAQIERIRAQVLSQARDPVVLGAEVIAMRLRMLEGHVNRSQRFDLKHDRGGMVDIEFVVQYLVLAHAHRHAGLLANRGNIGLLSIAADLALIDADLARACAGAYRRYRQLQHALRLNGVEHARVDRSHVQAEIDAVERLWRTVLGTDEPRPPAGRKPASGSAPGTIAPGAR